MGILGVSLLLCLFIGIVLCLLSVAYVFTLKNNKPEHYDTDFFEAALVEAGVLEFCFGPRSQRKTLPETFQNRGAASRSQPAAASTRDEAKAKATRPEPEPVVSRVVYERLQEELTTTEELLEDALAERAEG